MKISRRTLGGLAVALGCATSMQNPGVADGALRRPAPFEEPAVVEPVEEPVIVAPPPVEEPANPREPGAPRAEAWRRILVREGYLREDGGQGRGYEIQRRYQPPRVRRPRRVCLACGMG